MWNLKFSNSSTATVSLPREDKLNLQLLFKSHFRKFIGIFGCKTDNLTPDTNTVLKHHEKVSSKSPASLGKTQ